MVKITLAVWWSSSSESIFASVSVIPEFREALGEDNVDLLKNEASATEGLKEGFATMMRQPKEKVESLTRGVMARANEPSA